MSPEPVKLAGKPYEIHLLAVILLYILGFAIHLNSFSVPFVFDDYPNIRDNPSIRLTEIDARGLRTAAFESRNARRPIANISFALNYVAGGYDVKGYHLVNIFIHVVNGVLVYFLALILLRRHRTITGSRRISDRRLRLVALFAAAIFIAHPLQIQAVTYIVQRMTSMATMFYLTSLLLYLLGRQRADLAERSVYWLGALAAWLLALGSKEISATLPVIILIVELLFYRDPRKAWPGINPGYLLFAIIASSGVALLYLGADPTTIVVEQYVDREFSLRERLLTELRVLVFYLNLMVFPYPGRLSLEHAFNVSHSLIDPVSTLLAAAVLVALIVVALRLARRHPILSFCILWFFVTLSIESSFIGLELVFEHRTYLPMFGFALAVAYLFSTVSARYDALAIAIAGVLVSTLAAASIARNMTWQNPVALWMDTVSKAPSSHRARNNLGRVLADQGEGKQAIVQFKEAIRLEPDYAEPHNNLGALHAQAGRFDQAQGHFDRAIELNPAYAQAYNNLGVSLLRQGHVHKAASQLSQAVRIAPGYAKAHANLSVAFAQLGQPLESCRHLLIALRLDSTLPHSEFALESCKLNSNTN
jgi:tetratricopeptide (TPR) repeat protein